MKTFVKYGVFFLFILIMTLSLFACQQSPQAAVTREALDQATRKIRADHLAWAEKLTTDPATGKNHCDEIQPLSQNSWRQIQALHQEYQQLISEDRQRNPGSSQTAIP